MEELKQKLVDLCNESQLPLEAIFFVAKDLYRDVDEALRAYKTQQTLASQQQEKVEEEKE